MLTAALRRRHLTDWLFTFALFSVFTVCALLVVVIGTSVYRSIAVKEEPNLTALSYISEKIRQNDHAGSIELGSAEGVQVLMLRQTYASADYITYIYVLGDELKEALVAVDHPFSLSDGQTIMQADSLTMERGPLETLHISVTGADGTTGQMIIDPYCS